MGPVGIVSRLTPSWAQDRHPSDDHGRGFADHLNQNPAFFIPGSVARAVLKKTVMPTKTSAQPKRKQPKRAPKLSRKALADRRREYAAKFFPYIEKVARRLARRLPAHVEIDDLISSGVIGLMEAAERYDPKR